METCAEPELWLEKSPGPETEQLDTCPCPSGLHEIVENEPESTISGSAVSVRMAGTTVTETWSKPGPPGPSQVMAYVVVCEGVTETPPCGFWSPGTPVEKSELEQDVAPVENHSSFEEEPARTFSGSAVSQTAAGPEFGQMPGEEAQHSAGLDDG